MSAQRALKGSKTESDEGVIYLLYRQTNGFIAKGTRQKGLQSNSGPSDLFLFADITEMR